MPIVMTEKEAEREFVKLLVKLADRFQRAMNLFIYPSEDRR